MADGSTLSTHVLRDTAQVIRNIHTGLTDKLTEINKTMADLGDTWQSKSSTEIRETMNALKPRFEKFRDIVDTYAAHLDSTASSYESTESAAKTNADAFRSR